MIRRNDHLTAIRRRERAPPDDHDGLERRIVEACKRTLAFCREHSITVIGFDCRLCKPAAWIDDCIHGTEMLMRLGFIEPLDIDSDERVSKMKL